MQVGHANQYFSAGKCLQATVYRVGRQRHGYGVDVVVAGARYLYQAIFVCGYVEVALLVGTIVSYGSILHAIAGDLLRIDSLSVVTATHQSAVIEQPYLALVAEYLVQLVLESWCQYAFDIGVAEG